MEEIKKGNNMFYIGDESSPIAKIVFTVNETNDLVVQSTKVDDSLRGKGIAGQLLSKVVELARQENKKIIPVCSYAVKVLTSSDNYKDVLVKK